MGQLLTDGIHGRKDIRRLLTSDTFQGVVRRSGRFGFQHIRSRMREPSIPPVAFTGDTTRESIIHEVGHSRGCGS
jgi:hypothetical protein